MQFQKDIFISYAHIDDMAMIEGQKGWIAEFHRGLEIRLSQLLGRRPIIWRDPALQGNHIFDKEISDQFDKVALVISIMTPRYVKSDWCKREVEEFYNSCLDNIGFVVKNQARVFKVIKTPVKLDMQPETIQPILGYEFYNYDTTTGRIKEYLTVPDPELERAYWSKLDDLANDIKSFLEEIEANTEQVSEVSSPKSKESKGKVFLAETSYESKDFRESIKRELQDQGYDIYPDKQLPLIATALEQEVNKYIQDSDFSIHVLGDSYGIIPEGAQKSIIEIQNELASQKASNSKFKRLIWIPEGKTNFEPRQESFVNKLTAGIAGMSGAELIQGPLESFKNVVSDLLDKLQKEQSVVESNPVSTDNGSKTIYLICDRSDLENIKPLEDFLFENGYEVLLPIFDGEETSIREDHRENLKFCDAAILFYGLANEMWLRAKMRDFLKISAYGRETPLNTKIVYIGDPKTEVKQRFRTQGAEIIDATGGEIPKSSLIQLLNKL